MLILYVDTGLGGSSCGTRVVGYASLPLLRIFMAAAGTRCALYSVSF